MKDKLAHVSAVIWDFDGVFYDFDALPDNGYNKICDHCNAMAVTKIIPNLKYEDAVRIAHQSYELYKECLTAYLPYAAKIGMEEKEFEEIIFHEYHRILMTETMSRCPFILAADDKRTALFAKLDVHIQHGILSHSSAADFVIPSLENMNLRRFFKDSNLWDFKSFGFANKGKGPEGIKYAITKLGLEPKQIVFAEDTAKNLQVAKAAFPEIVTVLKTHENIEKPEGIDIMVYSQNEFLEILCNSKGL